MRIVSFILVALVLSQALAHAAETTANAHDARDFVFFLSLYALGFVLFSITSGVFKNTSIKGWLNTFGLLFMMFVCVFFGGFVALAGYGSVFMHENDETKGQKMAKYSVFAVAVFLVVFFVCFIVSGQAHAGQETRYYGPKGDYVGRSSVNTANPRQQNVYDNHGKYVGRVMTSPDGQQRFYDNHGNYKGRSTGWTNIRPNK